MPIQNRFPLFRDSEAFAFLLEFINSAKIKIRAPRNTVGWDHFCFDALAWRPAHYELSPAQAADPFELYHHGFHYLLAHRYGPELFQRPRFTLMAEALASGLEVFFATSYFKSAGARHPSVKRFLTMCRWGGDVKKEKLVAFLRKNEKNPFVAYRQVSLEVFGLCELLLVWCSTLNPSKLQIAKFKRGVRALRFRHLYNQLMFEIYMIFVLGHCTPKSSPKDLRDIKDIRRKLTKAKTMLEFFGALKAPARRASASHDA